MKKNYFTKITVMLCVVTGCMMLLLLIYLGTVKNIEVFQSRENDTYQTIEEYSCRKVEDENTPIGVKKEYSWIVEDTPKGDTCLAFYVVHQCVKVSIDGKVVYSLMPSKKNHIGKTVGSNWVMVPLYSEDEGKRICVEILPVYKNCQNREINFLMGSRLAIYLHRMEMDMPQLVLGVMAILAGLVFVVIALYNFWKKRKSESLAALGIFSVMMGLWRLTDTRSTPFLLPDKPVLLFYCSIGMLMLGMLPLIKSMQSRYSPKVRFVFNICCVLVSVVCLIQMALQVFGVADFRENLIVTHVMLVLGSAVIIGSIFYEKIKGKKKVGEHVGRRFSLICVAGVLADIIAYYVKGNSSGLIFTLSAFFAYTIFTGIVMLVDYWEQERRLLEQEKKLQKQEAALASSRIAILLSQIQPHFIFNSLTAIKSLCRIDVNEAVEALEHFAGYLRGSMDSLKERKSVFFETELNHVKNYLYLEQKRFGEKLQVVYDIRESNFLVPALSVQPMVENAVRHGVHRKMEGGCVTISSYTEGGYYIVRIADDGKGFDVKELEDMDENHVGIASVRERLEIMCNGKLEISSVPGKGTEVLIKIPQIIKL